jgi:quinol monooxygenase YgiN
MTMDRREFLATAGAAALGSLTTSIRGVVPMYGLIGKITTVPGKRDEFAAILLEGTGGMPGCLSYVIATDPSDADGLWITEVWDNQASHQASLALPSVKAAIARGRALIAGFSNRVETVPLGGIGIPKPEG